MKKVLFRYAVVTGVVVVYVWVGSFAVGQMGWSALPGPGIPVGEMLSGFTVRSELSPGEVNYSLFDENFVEQTGTVTGPILMSAPVPEALPTAMMILGGIYLVPVWLMRSKRRV